MRLWRADTTDIETIHPWMCFAADCRSAEAYTDNPGFGGPILSEVELPDPDRDEVLDLTDMPTWAAFQRLAETLAEVEPWTDRWGDEIEPQDAARRWLDACWQYPWEESREVARRLAESPIRWLMYEDDYPDGCVTWCYVGTSPIDI